MEVYISYITNTLLTKLLNHFFRLFGFFFHSYILFCSSPVFYLASQHIIFANRTFL